MTHFSIYSLLARSAFILSVLLTFSAQSLADEPAATEGPLLIEEAPPKPETEKYALRYQLKRGDILRYEVSHKASMRTTIENSTQAAESKTDSVKLWKVSDVLPEGEIEFMNVVERVHMLSQVPDRSPMEYDSDRDKTPPVGFEDAAKAIGVPLSVMRITPSGKVVHRERKVHGQGAEDDAPIVVRLPDAPVAIGDTWDEPFDLTVHLEAGGTKSIQTRRHHELTDVNNDIATIKVSYQILSPVDSFVEYQLVQKLIEGEVKFDHKAGRVVAQKMEIDKRILGFAGPTSSTQYIMRMEEKLVTPPPPVAQQVKPRSKSTKTTANKRGSTRSTARTATKPRTTKSGSRSRSSNR
jgi:hypothetical protein